MNFTGKRQDKPDDKITNLIQDLDKSWYLTRLPKFESLCEPGETYYVIEHELDEDQEKALEEGSYSFNGIEYVDATRYFYYKRHIGSRHCGEDVENKIISIISQVIEYSERNSNVIKKVLSYFEALIKGLIDELKIDFNDAQYSAVINYFSKSLNNRIHNHFFDKIQSLELIEGLENIDANTKIENKIEISSVEPVVPRFITEYIPEIIFHIKHFFSEEDQARLQDIFTSNKLTSMPLQFNSNGNKLADAFKQLYEKGVIIGTKKQLQSWINKSFTYKSKGKVVDFKLKYLDGIISSSDRKCKKPIIEVKKNSTSNYVISRP